MKTYVTLLSNADYLIGVLKLYKSMKKVGCKYPLLCVCSPSISDGTKSQLTKKGIEVLSLEKTVSQGCALFEDEQFSHWRYSFDKLLLWGLTQYERMVFLDADMMLVSNTDELFSDSYLPISAVQAGFSLHKDWIRLNSGLIIIEPSVDTMNRMLAMIEDVVKERSKQGLASGDQDVINAAFPQWPDTETLHLAEGYNAIFKYIDDYCKLSYGFGKEYAEKEIKVIHFIGKVKPWHHSGLKKTALLIKYLLKRSRCLPIYWKYIWL